MLNHVISSVLAIILGQIAGHIIKYIPTIIEDEKAYRKFFPLFNLKNNKYKFDYIYSIINLILFNSIVGMYEGPIAYIYMVAFLALEIAFVIDYKMQLIPDTCHVILIIAGLVNILLDMQNVLDYLLGFGVGAGAFYLISIFSKLVFKKDGMGFGDVKLMAGIGLLVGFESVLAISLLAFILSAVISLILIICTKKKMNSYIPFGPFIVIATALVAIFGSNTFIEIYLVFCTWLGNKVLDFVYLISK